MLTNSGTPAISIKPVITLDVIKVVSSFMTTDGFILFDSKTQSLFVTKAKATAQIQLKIFETKTLNVNFCSKKYMFPSLQQLIECRKIYM